MLTHDGGNQTLAPNGSFNVGDAVPDDSSSSGQAGFVVHPTGRAVRVEWSLAENVLGDDCYLSGMVTG